VRTSIVNRIALAAIVGCVAAASLAVAGCGGGSSSTTTGASGATGSAPLSQSEFASQANAICKEANTKQEALKPPPTGGPASGFEPFITQSLAITQPLLTQLEALTPPSNLQSDWDKLLADAKAKEALVQKALAAAKANDTSQFSAAIKQVQAMAGQGDALAQSIGLTECAKNPQPQG